MVVHAEVHELTQVHELNKSIEDFVAKLSPLELFNSVSQLSPLTSFLSTLELLADDLQW